MTNGQRILVVQQKEVRRQAKRSAGLITCACANLAVIVQASPEICAAAESTFRFTRNRELLGRMKDDPADADVTAQLALVGTLESGGRQPGIAGLAPHVSIAAAQRQARSDVDED